MSKIYQDKIISVDEINVLESENIFEKMKKISEDNKKQILYLEYIPSNILRNYDLNDCEDHRRFQDILYKCDTPVLPMSCYNLKDNEITIWDPSKNTKGLFTFCEGKLIYTIVNHDLNYQKKKNNIPSERYISDITFFEILNLLLNQASEYYIHYTNSDLSNKFPSALEKVKKEDILNLINLSKEEKILKKVR